MPIVMASKLISPFRRYLSNKSVYQNLKRSLVRKFGGEHILEEYSSYEGDIERMYAASNARLASIMNLDLTKYGYLGGKKTPI